MLLPYRRWAFGALLRRIERPLAPITVLRGPRQVGKTTLQEQLIDYLISKRRVENRRILRVQFDDLPQLRRLTTPILAISALYQDMILGESFNEAAQRGKPAILFFDEVQNLPDWAIQLKTLVDHNTVSALVTGSSSLRIEAGRDSLAGRFSTVTLGTLLLREIAGVRGYGDIQPSVEPTSDLTDIKIWRRLADRQRSRSEKKIINRAFSDYSKRGGYPIVHKEAQAPWPEMAGQLNESVIKRAIRHDLRLSEHGGRRRDPNLLEEVFRLACRYAGQAPGKALYIRSLKESLNSDVGWQRVLSYLRFLDGALLLRLVWPLEIRTKKQRSNIKICLCDHGLRASWLGESIPIDPDTLAKNPELSGMAGHIVESVVGAFFKDHPDLRVDYMPEQPEQPEVDFIVTIGDRRIPFEVKYQRRIDEFRDTLGLRAFIEKTANRASFGLLITQEPTEITDPRIIAVTLPNLLLLR